MGSHSAHQDINALPASQLLLCTTDVGLVGPGAGLVYVLAAPSAPADNETSGAPAEENRFAG